MSMTYDSSFLYDRSGYAYEGQLAGVPGLPSVVVFIAFSDSPYVANPGWTEVTQYVRTIPNIRRSRSDDWSTFSGSATVVLNNRDQRFNPFNTSSPYNGLLKPRRQIKIVANANGVEYPLFRGYISGWPVDFSNNGEDSTVSIECFDALALINQETTPQDLVDSYIKSLNPVYYFPLNDPISTTSTTNTIKGQGSNAFDIPGGNYSVANSSRMADGLSPSAFSFVGTSASFFFVGANASTRPATSNLTVAGWWTAPTNDTFGNYSALLGTRLGNLNVNVHYSVTNAAVEILVRLVLTPTSYTYKYYRAPFYLEPSTPHHIAALANADGTLNSVICDGQTLSPTLIVNTTETGSLDLLLDFFTLFGIRQSWSVYNYHLTTDQVSTLYSFSTARIPETTTARFNRLFAFTGFPTALTAAPASPVGVVSELTAGGTSIVNELNKVRNSEGGELYVSKSGVITMTERNSQLTGRSATTQAIFKDDGTNLKYAGDFNLRYDADGVLNELRYSVTGGADIVASDTSSQGLYGKQEYSVDTQISTVADAQSLANTKLAIFDTPIPQVSPLEVGITRSLSQWQTLLSLELLDQIEVTRTPSVGSVFSDRLLVNEISHSITPEDWSMSIVGSARYSEWFTIDIDFIDGDRLIA